MRRRPRFGRPLRRPSLRRLHPVERQALGWWLVTRLAALWIAAQAMWLVGNDTVLEPYLTRWVRWDARVFTLIAQYGYDGPGDGSRYYEAFFPGLPLAIRALHVVVPSWNLCGLLISLVAGAVGIVALCRIALLEYGPDVARRAAVALCVSPFTGFLAAGYSESLFLAFAFPSWVCAKRGRWGSAVVLAAFASTTRITGAFLAAALLVEYLTARDRRPALLRSWRSVVQLLLFAVPVAPILVFFGYLHARTGDWLYYFTAQREGWGRNRVGVRQTFDFVRHAAGESGQHLGWTYLYRWDLAVMAIGVALIVGLAVRRRWAEAVFVALPVVSLAPMGTYSSAPRTALTWWPLWVTMGLIATRSRWGPWLDRLYLALSVPSAVLLLAAFTLWHWAG